MIFHTGLRMDIPAFYSLEFVWWNEGQMKTAVKFYVEFYVYFLYDIYTSRKDYIQEGSWVYA